MFKMISLKRYQNDKALNCTPSIQWRCTNTMELITDLSTLSDRKSKLNIISSKSGKFKGLHYSALSF